MWSNDNNIAVPKERAHVNTECVGERDAGDVRKTTPSDLNMVEQDEEESNKN